MQRQMVQPQPTNAEVFSSSSSDKEWPLFPLWAIWQTSLCGLKTLSSSQTNNRKQGGKKTCKNSFCLERVNVAEAPFLLTSLLLREELPNFQGLYAGDYVLQLWCAGIKHSTLKFLPPYSFFLLTTTTLWFHTTHSTAGAGFSAQESHLGLMFIGSQGDLLLFGKFPSWPQSRLAINGIFQSRPAMVPLHLDYNLSK